MIPIRILVLFCSILLLLCSCSSSKHEVQTQDSVAVHLKPVIATGDSLQGIVAIDDLDFFQGANDVVLFSDSSKTGKLELLKRKRVFEQRL